MKKLFHLFVTPLTSYLKPLTSYLTPLTSHLTPLTSHLTPLTSYLLPLFAFCIFQLSAQDQFPDSSFENWTTKSGAYGTFVDFDTEFFHTLNPLHALGNEAGGGKIDLTAFRDEFNPVDGLYSIKLVSGRAPMPNGSAFLPGMVGTIDPDFIEQFLAPVGGGGITIATDWGDRKTPCTFEGWYKYDPKNNDSAFIDIGFYNSGKEVFSEKLLIKNKVDTWTKFSLKIPQQYWNQYFEEIKVLFVASAGVDFETLTNCKGQEGSALSIDAISLLYECEASILQNLLSTVKVNVFPNPATNDILNMELNENFTGVVSIYSILGGKVMEQEINGDQCQLNIKNLSSGNYIYKLMNGNTIFAQGKFVVTK